VVKIGKKIIVSLTEELCTCMIALVTSIIVVAIGSN